VQIIKQVASALSVAHAEGVVHRDLKPGNVFLVRRPDDAIFVKVVDFGISKVLRATTTKLTMARAVVGTPEFMSPEQASGRVDLIDHRSDQWALACLAWHMLSGRLPFWHTDVSAILEQVITGQPTPLAPEYAGLIPRDVDKVLRRALSKKREDRFPTINAFARAFEAAAASAPARPNAPAAGRRAPAIEAPRRRSGLWIALGAAALIAAAAGWMFRVEITSSSWWPEGLPTAGSVPRPVKRGEADGRRPAGEGPRRRDSRRTPE
jgi:serine/threonine protein kinase